MTAREMLGNLQHIQREIQTKSERAGVLESVVNKATTSFSDMPRGGYDPHKREKALTALIDLKGEIYDRIADLVEAERSIRKVIGKVEDPILRAILEMHYINGLNWVEISEELDKTPRQIYRLRDKAIMAADDVMRS